MTEVIAMQKDHLGLWKMAGEAFPEQQLKNTFADFLKDYPQTPFQNAQVYEVPIKGMPESVVDALFMVRSEGHAMYCPGSPRKDDYFEVDKPIYELLIELIMGLLGKLVGMAKGSNMRPGGKTMATSRPKKGQPAIGFDKDF